MAPSANFVDLCRICATETQSIVRHFIFEGEGKLRDLSKKIAACLPVKIKDDDRLPKVLCGECVYKLDLLHEFREKSQKTEAYLFTLIDGPDIEHHVRQQSSSQLDDEEEDDDSHGGDDGGHDDFDEPEPTPPRRNAQGQICEPEVVIKVEEENSKGAASTARAAVASTPQAGTSTEQEDDGGPSSSKRPRRAAANKRPIREDSPSLLDDVDAPSSPPPPKRRGRKPKGQSPGGSATPGTSTSGSISGCDWGSPDPATPRLLYHQLTPTTIRSTRPPKYPPKCNHNTNYLRCALVTRDDCVHFNSVYHSLSSQEEKHAFLLTYVTMETPKRRRPRPTADSPADGITRVNRSLQVRYYIPHETSVLQVCRVAFVEVLNISFHMVTRVFKHYFLTGRLPVDGRGGDRRSARYEQKRQNVLEYLTTYRENELMHNGDKPLSKMYCAKTLWVDYNKIAEPDLQVRLCFFSTLFAENFDFNLNPKCFDGSLATEDTKKEPDYYDENEFLT